jgi:hypothetical protein
VCTLTLSQQLDRDLHPLLCRASASRGLITLYSAPETSPTLPFCLVSPIPCLSHSLWSSSNLLPGLGMNPLSRRALNSPLIGVPSGFLVGPSVRMTFRQPALCRFVLVSMCATAEALVTSQGSCSQPQRQEYRLRHQVALVSARLPLRDLTCVRG